MSDISANLVIGMPAQLFTLARSFKANVNGKIYIGQPDTDPTNPANQIQVYVENEDGSPVPVQQPIVINAGGFPVLNGQIKKFVTMQNYSMAVYDAYNAQQFYFEDIAKYDPDQLRQQLEDPDGAVKYPELQMARWRDEGDIRGWGAKGNANKAGTAGTDDTAAIRAAISSGKKLKIPPRHLFLVTDTIIIPSNTTIVAEDKFSSGIVAAVTMEGSLDVMQNAGYNTAPITYDENIVLSGFLIHANGFTRTKTADGEWGRCLRTGAVRNIYLTDMVFQEGPQHCLDLACWRNSHENAGHAGVVQGMTENAVVTNCDIIDYCRDDGLTTHGASGVTIDGCVSRITDYAKSVNNYSITQNGFEIDDGSYNVIVTNCRAYCNNTFSKGFSTANHENNPPPHNVRFINCDTYEGVAGVSLLGAINSSVAFGTENWRARNYVIHNCSLIYPHAATGPDYPSRAVEARIVMDVDIRNFRVQMRGDNGEASRSPCAITNIDTAVNVSFDGLRVEGVPDGDMGTGFGTGRAWFRISNTETHNIRIRNVSIDNIGWADRIINDNTNVAGAAALKVVDGIYLGRNSTDGRQKTAVMSSAFADFKNVNVPAGVQALRIGRQFFDRSALGSRVEVNYDSPKAILGGIKLISETAADGTQPVPGLLFDRQFTSSSNQNGKGCVAFRTSVSAPGSFNVTAYDEDTGRYEPMLAMVWTAAGTIKKYIAPIVDGDMNNGNAGARWLNVHSVNGVITTSDADDKDLLRDAEEKENAAFAKIARLPSVWKWIRRVEEEGEDARWHSGPTVQAAIAIMDEFGLAWDEYSCFCYDHQPYVPESRVVIPAQIDEVSGLVISPEREVITPATEESETYGFRKEELLWWCHRALASQLDRMEERLARLESQ